MLADCHEQDLARVPSFTCCVSAVVDSAALALVSLARSSSHSLQFREVSRINPAHVPTKAFLKLLDEASKSGIEVDTLGTVVGASAGDGVGGDADGDGEGASSAAAS